MTDLLTKLNQEIDWTLLEAFGFNGVHDFEAPVLVDTTPSIPTRIFMKGHQNYQVIHEPTPAHLLFWAVRSGPMVMAHLRRACEKVGYQPNLDMVSQDIRAMEMKMGTHGGAGPLNLLHWAMLPIEKEEYLEKLPLIKENIKKIRSRESVLQERIVFELLEWGANPNAGVPASKLNQPNWTMQPIQRLSTLAPEKYSVRMWEAFEKQGYVWPSNSLMSEAFSSSPSGFSIQRMDGGLKRGWSLEDTYSSGGETLFMGLMAHYFEYNSIATRYMKEHGANLHAVNKKGQNSWHLIARELSSIFGHFGSSKALSNPSYAYALRFTRRAVFLKKNEVDINVQDDQGQTPLHILCRGGAPTWAVSILLRYGVDWKRQDQDGKSAMDLAYEFGHTFLLDPLLQLQALEEKEHLDAHLEDSASTRESLSHDPLNPESLNKLNKDASSRRL